MCQGSVLLCHLFLPLVSIFGLFPVLVSCHYEFICVQLCVCDCVNYPVYISPVFWVWFHLVYSLLPRCFLSLSPALSYLDVSLKTIIWVYVLVCVFLFLPAVCTVTICYHILCKYCKCLTIMPILHGCRLFFLPVHDDKWACCVFIYKWNYMND